jgi:hypothetical protein
MQNKILFEFFISRSFICLLIVAWIYCLSANAYGGVTKRFLKNFGRNRAWIMNIPHIYVSYVLNEVETILTKWPHNFSVLTALEQVFKSGRILIVNGDAASCFINNSHVPLQWQRVSFFGRQFCKKSTDSKLFRGIIERRWTIKNFGIRPFGETMPLIGKLETLVLVSLFGRFLRCHRSPVMLVAIFHRRGFGKVATPIKLVGKNFKRLIMVLGSWRLSPRRTCHSEVGSSLVVVEFVEEFPDALLRSVKTSKRQIFHYPITEMGILENFGWQFNSYTKNSISSGVFVIMTAKNVCPNFSSDKTEPNFWNRLILVGVHHSDLRAHQIVLPNYTQAFFWVEVNLTFIIRVLLSGN